MGILFLRGLMGMIRLTHLCLFSFSEEFRSFVILSEWLVIWEEDKEPLWSLLRGGQCTSSEIRRPALGQPFRPQV